jgi:hypothetical protein
MLVLMPAAPLNRPKLLLLMVFGFNGLESVSETVVYGPTPSRH